MLCCAEPGQWPVKPCMLCICPSSIRISHSSTAMSQGRLCLESDIKQGHEAIAGAGVRCVVVETRHPSHAKEIVAALPTHELELYDGILAVNFSHRTTNLACCGALQCSETQPVCHICGAIIHHQKHHLKELASGILQPCLHASGRRRWAVSRGPGWGGRAALRRRHSARGGCRAAAPGAHPWGLDRCRRLQHARHPLGSLRCPACSAGGQVCTQPLPAEICRTSVCAAGKLLPHCNERAAHQCCEWLKSCGVLQHAAGCHEGGHGGCQPPHVSLLCHVWLHGRPPAHI